MWAPAFLGHLRLAQDSVLHSIACILSLTDFRIFPHSRLFSAANRPRFTPKVAAASTAKGCLGLNKNGNYLDAKGFVAFACETFQENALKEVRHPSARHALRSHQHGRPNISIQHSQVVPKARDWLVIGRKWDETTMVLQWNKIQSRILLKWVLARAGFQQPTPRVSKNRHGSLQIMVQQARLRWSLTDSEVCVLPPLAVERSNAETLMAAMERASPTLSFSNLCHLLTAPAGPKQALLILTADSASSNERLKNWYQGKAPENLHILAVPCCIHQVHRVIKIVLATSGVLSPLYSLSHLLRFSDVQSKLAAAILCMLGDHLQYERVRKVPQPAVSSSAIGRIILDHSLLRGIRSAAKSTGSYPQPRKLSPAQLKKISLADRILGFFNGDWHTSVPQHFCAGCCPHRAAAIQKAATLILESLLDQVPGHPALSRWTSTQNNIAWWSLATGLHNLVAQAWCKTWPNKQVAPRESAEEDDEDWHALVRERTLRSTQFLQNTDTRTSLLVISLITYPIDVMMNQLSSADDPCNVNKVLQPMILEASAIFSRTISSLVSLALDAHSPLNTLLAQAAPTWKGRSVVWALSLAVGCYTRFRFLYCQSPLSWFRLLDAECPVEQRQQLATDLWNEPPCCRGVFGTKTLSSVKFREAFQLRSSHDLLGEPFLNFLTAASHEVGLAIADVERMHSRNRQASTGGCKSPPVSLERVRYESVLQSWFKEHLRRGGRDNRVLTLSSLAAAGVETIAQRRRGRAKRSARAGTGGSPWILFKSAKLKGCTFAHDPPGGLTAKGKRQAFERELRHEWLSQDAEARRFWASLYKSFCSNKRHRSLQRQCAADNKGGTPSTPARSLWDCGDGLAWPVVPAKLQDVLVKPE